MSVFALKMIGRFGNQCLQYAFARAYAERHGMELQTQPWIGEHIFEITPNAIRIDTDLLVLENENTIADTPTGDLVYTSYSQQQRCLIYTRSDLKRWFKFRPELAEKLGRYWTPHCAPGVVAHRRVGDLPGYGYAVVSKNSYRRVAERLGMSDKLQWLTEENPHVAPDVPAEYSFVTDFWRMVQAPILLRGNSTFSWLAGALGNGVVYSPVIDGLEGGKEHDVDFVLGNHPRLSHHSFCTELRLQE